jgi:hypothetical protein
LQRASPEAALIGREIVQVRRPLSDNVRFWRCGFDVIVVKQFMQVVTGFA